MNGAWIIPNGSIIYTTDNTNHEQSLKTYNILKYINLNIQFSEYEYAKNMNKDIRYIAFKSGIIRIICAYKQFAVECILEKLTSQTINAIYLYLNKQLNNNIVESYIIENALDNKTYFFNTLLEFKNFLTNYQ